ncbi:hypothetical protein DKG77_06120 [Flagellimonas aquimarina]|uniref:AraC effector-binding domain-containing protein n=1 Tax=Flagellimonas aquimarina TaxID=2201895 RepID=A0A316L4P3_9FLAO|nr:GyrI-like domain-containing protein [Allomuricauda koreensis]PWL40388.1 hypothetical protein DKG77_06120 [Allomuricauda koreensis]
MKTPISTSKIKVKTLPKRTLAYVSNVGRYKGDSALFEKLFTKVRDWAEPKELLASPKTEAISVYLDDPDLVPEEKQTIRVGFTVPEGTKPEDEIQLMELPKAEYLVASFEILPTEYEEAWQEIMGFIQSEKLKLAQLMYESYKNDPRTHPEGKHIVDICIAIES